jgi:hypothetical protein
VKTELLIERLTQNSGPIRPLAAPWLRALTWVAVCVPYVTFIAFAFGFRSDLAAKTFEIRFGVEQAAALATGFTAAVSAFALVVPGRSKMYFFLPLFPLAIWLGSIGVGCFVDLSHAQPHDIRFHADWFCLPGITLVGFLPGALIISMLWRGAPLFPHKSTALAGLAAAGIGDFGFRLFHPEDSGLIVLAWQMGTVFALAGIVSLGGQYLLNWRRTVQSKTLKSVQSP